MKLCVFPNDPLKAYFEKGEIKERYFNPKNLFDEIHVISFTDNEIEEERIKIVAGDAKLVIHCVGMINLINMRKKVGHIIKIVSEINPDVIRTFNPLIQGWIATKCSKELNIPLVLSIHGEFDRFRNMIKKQNFKQYLKLIYTSKFVEPYVIRNADRVICVCKVVIPYAKKYGAKSIDLIYNKVSLKKFYPKPKENETPVIITVGRLIKQKNHEIILNAIRSLNVKLIIIGDGEDYGRLVNIVNKLGINENVSFHRNVPNSQINQFYQNADIFVLAMRTDLESLPIPILEAMATGLPVIIPKSKLIELEDDLGKGVIRVENKPEEFSKAIKKILKDSKLYEKLSHEVLVKINDFNGDIMEEKESKLYFEIIKNNKKLF